MSTIVLPASASMFPRQIEKYATDDGAFLLPQSINLWPTKSSVNGNYVDGSVLPFQALQWEVNQQWPGTQTRKYITGTTRDRQGNPLAGCSVRVIHNSDNVFETSVTSGATGTYSVWVKNSDGYYLVGFLSGIPDVEGVTDNNVIGN